MYESDTSDEEGGGEDGMELGLTPLPVRLHEQPLLTPIQAVIDMMISPARAFQDEEDDST